MSFTKAKAYLESVGFADHIMEPKASTATVVEAAEALGVEPGMIAKTIHENVEVYLDESLKQFTTVYPAAGNDHSAVQLTIPELEQVANARGWVDVCKEAV